LGWSSVWPATSPRSRNTRHAWAPVFRRSGCGCQATVQPLRAPRKV